MDDIYLGLSLLFLALAGLILSRNRLKYFFALGVLFLWLLSFPREGLNIGLMAHWINALTNPLKTIPRSYYFTCHAMLPYLMMPLAVMGIEAMDELYRGRKYSGLALGLWAVLTGVLVVTGVPVVSPEARVYLIVCTVCALRGNRLDTFQKFSAREELFSRNNMFVRDQRYSFYHLSIKKYFCSELLSQASRF